MLFVSLNATLQTLAETVRGASGLCCRAPTQFAAGLGGHVPVKGVASGGCIRRVNTSTAVLSKLDTLSCARVHGLRTSPLSSHTASTLSASGLAIARCVRVGCAPGARRRDCRLYQRIAIALTSIRARVHAHVS